MEQDPPPAVPTFAEFLEEVRTTERTHQYSTELQEYIREPQDLQRQRNPPSRDDYWKQYVQALAANEHLVLLYFDFPRFTDICFLKHYLHSSHRGRLLYIVLRFGPRRRNDIHDDDSSHHPYEDLENDQQAVEIEHTIAKFVCLTNLTIRANVTHGAPRFTQALLKGVSQNPSLRLLTMRHMNDDSGLEEQQLDWTQSKLEKLHIEKCEFSISTWKGLLSLPSLERLELATSGDREEPTGRIPRHLLSRHGIFGSAKSRSIPHLDIKWQETDVTYLENLIRFFAFDKLTLDVRGLQLRDDEETPTPEEFQEKFSRICGLVDSTTNSQLYLMWDHRTTTEILSDFPELLRTILGFPAVVGMTQYDFMPDDFDGEWHSAQCLRVLTERGEYLERLEIYGIRIGDDEEICKLIANLPRLKYLTVYTYPTPSIAKTVDAHSNLLKIHFLQKYGEGGKKVADRARYRIERSLCRNRANRFARRIASRTTCSEAGAGLKLWPTILSNVDKGNVAALSGVFQAFRNDIERLLVQETQEQAKIGKMAAGRKRSREEEAGV